MALLTHVDHQSLQSWSFLADYKNRRSDLISTVPQPSECENALALAMLTTKSFADFLQKKKHATPALHLTFARQMAQLVLDNDWTESQNRRKWCVMEEITAKQAEALAIEAASGLTKELEALNQKSSGPDPIWSPTAALPTFTAIFARLLSDKYVIVPPQD